MAKTFFGLENDAHGAAELLASAVRLFVAGYVSDQWKGAAPAFMPAAGVVEDGEFRLTIDERVYVVSVRPYGGEEEAE